MTKYCSDSLSLHQLSGDRCVVAPQSILDIGSSKIAALIGAQGCGDRKVLGVGVSPANGIFAGCIADIEQAAQSIQAAVRTAEQMANVHFVNPIVVIGGNLIGWYPSTGMSVVRSGRVDESDIARAIEALQALPIPQDETIIDTQVSHYCLDLQEGIKKPLGMAANRITVQASLVTAVKCSLENLAECLKMAGYTAASFIPQAIAASHVALSEDARKDGVCLLDIGHATTDMAMYADGALVFLKSYRFGGAHISAAIADALHVPLSEADEYKSRLDFENTTPCGANEKVDAIVREMVVKLADDIQDDISFHGLRRGLRREMVLTGGIACIPGIDGLIGHRLHCHARTAKPHRTEHCGDLLASPAMTACIGAVASISSEYLLKQPITTDAPHV